MFNLTLVKLDLSHNEIGAGGGTQLAEMLRNNRVLRELDLSWNCMRGPAAARAGSVCSAHAVVWK
jgi:Ran GTPase-activating protein (RanGAP) involved in mRNA processing and transport